MFKLKKDDSGKLVKHKAQLMVKDFARTKEIDYNEILSLVVKMTSSKVILGLATNMDLELEQMDMKTTFLHGDLNEKTYMTQSDGLRVKGKEHLVCRLKKSLYRA